MLFIVFVSWGDLFFGSPCFMRPNSALIFVLIFSIFSKVILPLCIFLIFLYIYAYFYIYVFGSLNSIKLTEGIVESLKL